MEGVKLKITGGQVVVDFCDGSALMVMTPDEARETAKQFLKEAEEARQVGLEIIKMADSLIGSG